MTAERRKTGRITGRMMGREITEHGVTARDLGLIGCAECALVQAESRARCARCGARLRRPDRASLQAVWALLATGIIAYIPANLWPMLVTRSFGRVDESTIIGGAVDLAAHGAWFIAAVVLIASVAIPLCKFAAIAWLATGIARGSVRGLHGRHRLHTLVELIGRWSMIDVFVVAVLAALIQLGFLASVAPGPAAAPFALSVVLTMLAAQRLDARLIWIAADGRAR